MKNGKRFTRAPRGRSTDKRDATVPRVIIQVVGRSINGSYLKGNISRSFTVANARISDVATAIEKALFG